MLNNSRRIQGVFENLNDATFHSTGPTLLLECCLLTSQNPLLPGVLQSYGIRLSNLGAHG